MSAPISSAEARALVPWIVVLPWMPSALRPHATKSPWPRIHATKQYRRDCGQHAQAQGIRRIDASAIDAVVTFSPPHKRGDKQNDEAAFKAGIDGLADVVGVDDKHWNITWRHGDVVKGGKVCVELWRDA